MGIPVLDGIFIDGPLEVCIAGHFWMGLGQSHWKYQEIYKFTLSNLSLERQLELSSCNIPTALVKFES